MSVADLCRLCAETKENFVGIYDAEGQKLSVATKILRCLQIQCPRRISSPPHHKKRASLRRSNSITVLIGDDLPLSVCIDCCVQLDQCSDFFEKANQAQNTLRLIRAGNVDITETKLEPMPLESSVDYADEHEVLTKSEVGADELQECDVTENYLDNSANRTDYFENNKLNPAESSQNIEKQKSCRTIKTAQNLSKQTRKRIKRRPQMQIMGDLEITTDINEDYHHTNIESHVKIPENYMTGTESDIEMIEAQAADSAKPGQKSDKSLDRYPWLCTDCDDKLPSFDTLKKHHETVHNQKAKFMCVQCCKVYEKYYGFVTHVKQHKNKSKYRCDDCGKSFVHKKVLESHKAIHSETRPYVCQTCGKSFRQQSALYIHSRCHLPDTVKNRYPCDQCDKRFSTKPNLVTHQRIHSGVRNFTCDQCGKSFIQKGNLEAHFLTHSVDKPYNCVQCPKAFKTPLQLKKHETVHTGAKPHQCAVCGRTFREKGTLREHHRIHTGAMPFTCEFCGKCFRFKGILTTHRRQHTGERPYSCVECQHHFTNWPNYNKHMKRRHGINTSQTKRHQPPNQESQTNVPDQAMTMQRITPSIQVIQPVPHVSVTQPITLQTIPTSTLQNFQIEVPVTTQESIFRERNSTSYNSVPAALQNLDPSNLSYNFYNIQNVTDSDAILPR